MAGVTYEIDFAAQIARLTEGTVKGSQAVRKMADEMESASRFAKNALAALGATLSVGFFVNFLKNTNDAVAHMKELGQEAGTTAEGISRFEQVSRTAGLGLDAVAAAMFKMNIASLEAKEPQSKAAQALNAIGISTAQLKGLKPDEMFELVARSISKYGDGLAKNNIMQELFSKSGREMNRVVAEIAETGKLAATVTNEQADAAKLLDKQFVELKMNSEKFWRQLVSEGVPALNAIIKAFIDGKREGGLLQASIDALSQTFDQAFSKTLQEQLDRVNLNITNIQASIASDRWKLPGVVQKEAQWLEDNLARRKVLEAAIYQQRFEAQTRLQFETKPEKKKDIDFDPVAAANRVKAIQAQANALVAFNEQIAKDNAEMWNEANKDVLKNEEIIYQQRLDLAARYAAALQDETLGEAENVSDFARYQADKTRIEDEELKKRWGISQVYHQLDLTSASAFFGAMGAMMSSHNRAAFNIGKAAAISQTVIDTYRAAQGAYAALAEIPIVGPALGAAAAAAAIVAGLARVQQIRSTPFGGGSVSGGATGTFSANPNTGVPTAPISPVQTPAAQTGATSQTVVNIDIHGVITQTVADQLMDQLRDLFGNDGVLIPANSRQASVITSGI